MSGSVQPPGKPISHSTQDGFSEPPATTFRGFECLPFSVFWEGGALFFESFTVGVGSILTAVANPSPEFAELPFLL
jgi:hypothetical protein